MTPTYKMSPKLQSQLLALGELVNEIWDTEPELLIEMGIDDTVLSNLSDCTTQIKQDQ